MRTALLLVLLSSCTPAADAVAHQAVVAAYQGDLTVYQSLEGGDAGSWRRAVMRGSVCAEERAMLAKGWAFEGGIPGCLAAADGGAK